MSVVDICLLMIRKMVVCSSYGFFWCFYWVCSCVVFVVVLMCYVNVVDVLLRV